MQINVNWKSIVNEINGTLVFEGWNSGEGLGMANTRIDAGPEPWEGVASWDVGNCVVVVSSLDKENTVVELHTKDQTANKYALKTWERLINLLEEFEIINQLDASNAFYKLKRMGEIFNIVLLGTTSQNIIDWITTELPNISPSPIILGDVEIILGNAVICPPISDYPHHKIFINGIFHHFKEEKGEVEMMNRFIEAVMCIEIREINSNSVQVIGLCDDEDEFKQDLQELENMIKGIYEVKSDFSHSSTSNRYKDTKGEELLENYTLEEISALEQDVTGGKELLFYLAKDLLKDPPDPLAVPVARKALEDVIKTGLEYGISELDTMREWSNNLLESIPDLSTARAKSNQFIRGSEFIPVSYKQIIRQLNTMPMKDVENLLLSFPLVHKLSQDLKRTILSDASMEERSPLRNNREDELTLLESGIIDVCAQLNKEKASITDEIISSRLYFRGITNKEGNQYSREWINKKRNSLIDKGYKQCKL